MTDSPDGLSLSESDQEILRAYYAQGAKVEDINRTLLDQQTQLAIYQTLPPDLAQNEGVMRALMNDPETVRIMQNNPEARDAFLQTYYSEMGYQGGYDAPIQQGYVGGGYQPGAAFDAIAAPVTPDNASWILSQSPSFFQELALVDNFDPRSLGMAA